MITEREMIKNECQMRSNDIIKYGTHKETFDVFIRSNEIYNLLESIWGKMVYPDGGQEDETFDHFIERVWQYYSDNGCWDIILEELPYKGITDTEKRDLQSIYGILTIFGVALKDMGKIYPLAKKFIPGFNLKRYIFWLKALYQIEELYSDILYDMEYEFTFKGKRTNTKYKKIK